MNGSFPAQVSAVFDTNGDIHPRWVKFENEQGEIVKINQIEVMKENPKEDKISRNYLCRAYVYNQPKRFCLCYNMYFHSWSVEVRSSEKDYRFLVSHDRREFA